MGSISNISNVHLLNDKNENLFRNMTKREILKEEIVHDNNEVLNKINTIYQNKFIIKLKATNDKTNSQSKNEDKLTIKENNNILNKVKINNFIIKSKTYNDLEGSFLFNKNSSKILQRYCFICEVFEEKLYHTKNCNHLFCKECGRSFFDQQVEKGIYSLKCPKYNCYNNLNLNEIKEFLNPDAYIKIQAYNNLNNERKKSNSIDKSNIDNNNFIKSNINIMDINKNNNIKGFKELKKKFLKTQIPISNRNRNYTMHFMLKQHMIKISDSTRFKTRVKNEKEIKKVICSKCGKTALFTREDQNYIRCLNCENVICKFCYKQLGSNKSLRDLQSICGICYNNIKIKKNKSIIKKFLYEVLFIISGFFMVWIGFSKYESEFFVKNKKKKKYFLFILLFIIFLISNLVIFILFIPYFPIFISFFE